MNGVGTLDFHVAADHIAIMPSSVSRIIRHVEANDGLTRRWLFGILLVA